MAVYPQAWFHLPRGCVERLEDSLKPLRIASNSLQTAVLDMQSVSTRKRRDLPGYLIAARCDLVGPGRDTILDECRLEGQSLCSVMLIAESTKLGTPEAPLLGKWMYDSWSLPVSFRSGDPTDRPREPLLPCLSASTSQ